MKKSPILHATTGFSNPSQHPLPPFGQTDQWQDQDDLLVDDVNDAASMFYNDHFPTLPDFPCMSSSSSSSSINPAPVKSIASSSSTSTACSSTSAASWALLRSDADDDNEKLIKHHHHHHHHHHDHVDATPGGALSSTASMEIPQPSDDQRLEIDGAIDCMDHVMANLGYMDLIDTNDYFDPTSIFQQDDNQGCGMEDFQTLQENLPPSQEGRADEKQSRRVVDGGTEDLAMMFLNWLKSNKETVSAEDLRNVKLKRATVESAVARLGGGQTGMKELFKLVLEWVQTNHLPSKRKLNGQPSNSSQPIIQYQDLYQNPNPNPNITVPPNQANPSFVPSWAPPYRADPPGVVQGYPYMGEPFLNGSSHINTQPYSTPSADYPVIESAQTWPPNQFAMGRCAQFPDNNVQQQPLIPAPGITGYGNANPYPYQCFQDQPSDNKLVKHGSSAAKEARKKRMARQRRVLTHHRHHHHHNNHQNQQNSTTADQANPSNWVYWPSPTSGGGGSGASKQPMTASDAPPVSHSSGRSVSQSQQQNTARQPGTDKRQGWKSEKNLRFLLQKVLKQSDVGNLGRIVLPKKEAETHLPELDARDGIAIALEDIGTSRVWNMRYRFWPNNKSRMYLLENTGDFVKANGLQEGDFIVIYSDIKCGKYLIRGVKVRQQGQKPDTKKGNKSQKKN
ncbi:hypothetical protein ACFE04_002363 [Oxalis oulophora]